MTVKLHNSAERVVPDPSPFCLKLENFLIEARSPTSPLRSTDSAASDERPRKSPLTDETTGPSSAYSALATAHPAALDAARDRPGRRPRRARARGFARGAPDAGRTPDLGRGPFALVERARLVMTREAFFARLPAPLRALIGPVAAPRHGAEDARPGHGPAQPGRIQPSPPKHVGAVSALLGEDAFFFGATDRACSTSRSTPSSPKS